MTTRGAGRSALFIALAALTVAGNGCERSPEPVEPPPAGPRPIQLPPVPLDVGDAAPIGYILISVDTLRADYLSAYGHARILTPSIDRLASGGALFRRAFSASSTTSPSHSSMMTSLYLQDHNVYSNFEALGPEPQTMAEVFRDGGYDTFAIVNMRHMNPEVSGLGRGFNTVVPSGYMRRSGASIDTFLDWLDDEKRDGQPFMAFLHLVDCHTPYQPPPPYDRFYYDDDERDPRKRSLANIWPLLPKHMSDHPFFNQWLDGITDVDFVLAQYQGAVTYVDDEVGRLLDALEDRDLLHRTAITFTSDHGESLGEHGMHFVHTGLYDPTVHIPLIMYFPGSGRDGVEVQDIVEHVDIAPTVLEFFGLPAPKAIRGRSVWPMIQGEVVPPRIAFIEHAGENLVALRSERFKYIKHLRTNYIQPSYPFIEGREELYDLKEDPRELRDVSSLHPDVVALFRDELKKRRRQKLDLSTGAAEMTAETVEILRTLGYVE